jgi:putative sterol carrier protein
MAIEDIQDALSSRFGAAAPMGKVVRFDFGADGALAVDGTGGANVVAPASGGGAADCTLVIAASDMERVLDGSLDPTSAFMSGRLKIQGDMGVAMQLAAALG